MTSSHNSVFHELAVYIVSAPLARKSTQTIKEQNTLSGHYLSRLFHSYFPRISTSRVRSSISKQLNPSIIKKHFYSFLSLSKYAFYKLYCERENERTGFPNFVNCFIENFLKIFSTEWEQNEQNYFKNHSVNFAEILFILSKNLLRLCG